MSKTKTTNVHGARAGDILEASWGYDQTNIDFYLVDRVTAKGVYIYGMSSKVVDVGSSDHTSNAVVPGGAIKTAAKGWAWVDGESVFDETRVEVAPEFKRTNAYDFRGEVSKVGDRDDYYVTMGSYSGAPLPSLWAGTPARETAFGFGH